MPMSEYKYLRETVISGSSQQLNQLQQQLDPSQKPFKLINLHVYLHTDQLPRPH